MCATIGGIQWSAAVGETLDDLSRLTASAVQSYCQKLRRAANAEEPRVGRPYPRRNDSAKPLMVYAKNQIPSQINSNRLANDSQTAGGRQHQASLARDEHG
jgi:hypothetical protein